MNTAEGLGARIQQRRIELGYSQRGLSRMCGISNSLLSRIEAGKVTNTSPKILQKIAQRLKLPYEELMALAGYDRPGEAPEATHPAEIYREGGKKERIKPNPIFASRLREIRKKQGLERDELARLLGLTYAALSAYELGRVPDAQTLVRIADFLGVTTDYLLGRTDQQKPLQEFEVHEGVSIGWEPGPNADQEEWRRYITELISAVKLLTEEDRHLALSIVRSIKIHKRENSKDDQ